MNYADVLQARRMGLADNFRGDDESLEAFAARRAAAKEAAKAAHPSEQPSTLPAPPAGYAPVAEVVDPVAAYPPHPGGLAGLLRPRS